MIRTDKEKKRKKNKIDFVLNNNESHTSYVKMIQKFVISINFVSIEFTSHMSDSEALRRLHQLDVRNTFIDNLLESKFYTPQQKAWIHKLANDIEQKKNSQKSVSKFHFSNILTMITKNK